MMIAIVLPDKPFKELITYHVLSLFAPYPFRSPCHDASQII